MREGNLKKINLGGENSEGPHLPRKVPFGGGGGKHVRGKGISQGI